MSGSTRSAAGSLEAPHGNDTDSLYQLDAVRDEFPSEERDVKAWPTKGDNWSVRFNPETKRGLDVALVHTLNHESVACCVRFSMDGRFLATGCNHTAQIYDVKTGAKTCVLDHKSEPSRPGDMYIRSVCFSPNGKYLATASEDSVLRIWDIAKKRIRSVFEGHQQEVYSVNFSLKGRLVVSGGQDKTVRIWNMVDGSAKVFTINDADFLDAVVTSVALSPNDKLVAAGSLDTVVRIWDVATGSLLERLRGHRDSVYSVAFTPDGKGLVSGSLDKTLKHWDVSGLLEEAGREKDETDGEGLRRASRCTVNFTGHTDHALSVAASPDGQWIMSGSKDRSARLWSSHNGTFQCELQGHTNSVISVDMSPAGALLATGAGDWEARIWKIRNRTREAAPVTPPRIRHEPHGSDSILDLPATARLPQQSPYEATAPIANLLSFSTLSVHSRHQDLSATSDQHQHGDRTAVGDPLKQDPATPAPRTRGALIQLWGRFRRPKTTGNDTIGLQATTSARRQRRHHSLSDVAPARGFDRVHASGRTSPPRQRSDSYYTDADSSSPPPSSDVSNHGWLDTICFCLCIKRSR